jgi:hypothetical protein
VLLGAEKTIIEVEGQAEKLHLEDFYGAYSSENMWD